MENQKDESELLAAEIVSGEWDQVLCGFAKDCVDFFPIKALSMEISAAIGVPVQYSIWLDTYWTTRWIKVMRLAGLSQDSTVFEVGAGVSSSFVRAADFLIGSRGRYLTLTLNKELGAKFLNRSENLRIAKELFFDDALNISKYLNNNSCSFVAFNHQINDIVQTILYESTCGSTADKSWDDIRPHMVALVLEARRSSKSLKSVGNRFCDIVRSCTAVMPAGAWMGFNNAVIPVDIAAGYPPDVMIDYIRLAREWIQDGVPELRLEHPSGFDSRWWLFFSKRKP